MIKVKLSPDQDSLIVKFAYNSDYINRIRNVSTAHFDRDARVWKVSPNFFHELEAEFKGELVYLTPKWELEGADPPNYAEKYKHIGDREVELKEPYKPYTFQRFGSNFLLEQTKQFGFACLFDDMGTGSY